MKNDASFQASFTSSFSAYKAVIERSTRRIVALVDEVTSHPKTGAAYWDKVAETIDREYNTMQGALQKWTRSVLPDEYRAQIADAVEAMAKAERMALKASDVVASVETRKSIAAITSKLGRDAVADMAKGLLDGKAVVTRLTRATRQSLLDESVIDSALGKAYTNGDINSFMDVLLETRPETKAWRDTVMNGQLVEVHTMKDGKEVIRHFTPDYYAELVARTRFHEVQSLATLDVADNVGSDLVVVSNHNTTTPQCMEHEGVVYSISGNDPDFPPLTDSPPFHPNCLHTLHVTFRWAVKMGGMGMKGGAA